MKPSLGEFVIVGLICLVVLLVLVSTGPGPKTGECKPDVTMRLDTTSHKITMFDGFGKEVGSVELVNTDSLIVKLEVEPQ